MKSFPVSVLLVIALCVTALSLGYIVFNASDSSPLSFVSSTQVAQVGTTYNLSVDYKGGNGTGRVTHPGIVNCGYVCSASVSAGTAIQLYAIPDTDSTFTQWSTGPCAGKSTSPCNFTMSGATAATAVFTKNGTTPPPVTPPADTTAPVISGVSASALTTTGATVSWTTNEAADTQVEYGLTSSYGSNSALNATLATAHSATLSGLTSGTMYHYRVTSKDAAANKAVSSDGTFTTATPPISSTKFDLTVRKTDSNGNDSSVSNINYGRVFQTGIINCGSICSNQVSGNGAVELYVTADTGYTFTRWSTGPCAGTTANPCSFAMPGATTVTALFTKNGTTPTPADVLAPSVPTQLAATAASATQINLKWLPSVDAVAVTGYRIYRNGTQIGTSATLSYSSTGLTASTPYSYTVAAYDAAGNLSAQSAAASATTLAGTVTPPPADTSAPSIPTGLTATAISSSQINLAWNAATDNTAVTGYQVFRSEVQGSVGVQIANVTVPTQVTFQNISGLLPATTYWYSVSAYDAAGNISARSTPQVSAKTQAAAPTPDTTAPVVGTFSAAAPTVASLTVSVSLTATDNIGVTGYTVNESSAAPSATASGWTAAAPTTYTFTTAGAKILYAWAKDAAGNVSLSKAASVTVVAPTTPPPPPTGTVRYIRSGATGANNGASWTDAFTSIPATLIRGYTYYVADGTYNTAGYNFDDAASGSSLITIKKATAADHGAATDWDASTMGAGTAVFNGGIKVSTPYYVFDGATRGADWRSGYGIKINTNGQPKGVDFYNGCITPSTGATCSTAGNITLRNIEIVGNGMDNTTYDDGIFAAWGTNNVTISSVYIHDTGRTGILTGHLSNWLLEYSIIARNSSTVTVSTAHGSAWAGTMDSNIVVRYNRFEDIEGTAFLDWVDRGEGGADANFEIYGNTFLHSEGNPYNREGVTDGSIVAINTQVAQNWKIYNNTFININNPRTIGGFWHDGISIGNVGVGNRDVLVYNNYWWGGRNAVHTIYNCSTNCVVSNNRYDGVASTAGETGAQVVSTANTSAFVNYAGKDFRLSAPTTAGITLQSPYNADMNSVTRGADGTWDRGAYEYTGTTPPVDTTAPAPATGLTATVSAAAPTSQIDLAWTASVSGDVTGYKITRNGVQLTVVTGTTYTDSSLSPSTPYSYTVSAYDAAGNVSAPASASATTGGVVTTPPSTKFAVTGKVQVTGTANTSGTGYLNVRSTPTSVSTGNIISTAGTIVDGTIGTVTSAPSGYTNGIFADTYYWWYVNFGTITGWVVEPYLAAYTAPANTPPTVSIATPTVSGTAPATVSLSATAADADGTISSVSFYNGSTLIGTDTAAPYTFSWTGVAAGTYSNITARATDNSGVTTISGATSVTVAAGPSTPPGTAGNTCSGTCYYITPSGGSATPQDGRDWAHARQGLTGRAAAAAWTDNVANLAGDATYYVAGGGSYPVAVWLAPHSGGMTKIVKATIENSGLVTGWNNIYANQANLGAIIVQGDNYVIDGVRRNETKWDDSASYGFAASWTKVDSRQGTTGNHITFKYLTIGAADAGPGGWSSYPGHGFEYYKQSGTPLTDYYMGYSYLHTFSDVPIRFNNTSGAIVEYNFIGPSYTKEALRGDAGVSNITIRHNIFLNNCQDIPNSFPGGNDANGCTAEIGPWDGGDYYNWQIYGNVFKETVSNPHSDALIFGGTYSITDPGHKAHDWQVYNNVATGMIGGGQFNRINIDGTNNSVRDNFWYNNGPASGITCDTWGGSTTCTNNKIVTSVTEAYANILPVIRAQVQ